MPRYVVEEVYRNFKYEVHDTTRENILARKGDGTLAIYVGRDAREHAEARAVNMEVYGEDFAYDGKWKAGSRGRPPREVEALTLEAKDAVTVEKVVYKDTQETQQKLADALAEIKHLKEAQKIKINTNANRVHYRLEALLRAIRAGVTPLLVGPAGTGKTTAAEQVAETLHLPFHAISVGSQTTMSHLVGFMHANGGYTSTAFRQAYEHGGVFLCDEIDAGNASVLIVLNSALAGTFCAFPDQMVRKHKDFVFIGTANTYGMGANRQYVGRNQLDAATLDRFVPLDWPVDEELEASFVAHLSYGSKWHNVVKAVRKLADNRGMRVVVSPRATIKGANLLENGFTFEEVAQMVLISTATEDQKREILSVANATWGN